MKPPRLESPARVVGDVLRIFAGDVRYGVKNVIGIIVLMGLVLVPPMYAWFNIAGSWDPYGHTEGLKVAVANEDAGYESDLTPVDINMGDAVVSSLRADDSFDWVFVSEDEAVEGIRSGRYYAAIVIPEGFSADMMTLFSPDVTHSEITYYTNEKENPIAPRITEKGAASVQDSVRVKFTETVDKAALSLASDLVSYLDGDQVSTYAARMDGHMADAARDMRSAEGDMRAFSSLMTAASGLSDASASMLSSSKDTSSGAASSITDAASGLSDASDSFDAATGAVQGALAQSLAGFDGLDAEVTSALDDAQGRSGDASAILRSAAQEAGDSRAAYESVRDAVAAIPAETYAPLYVLGASFVQIVRHIIVPASLPKFITAVRVAMATAISVLFFTETFGTQYGIGYYIMDAWLRVNYLDMYAGIVVLSTMGLLLFALLDWAERRLCAWNRI